MTSVKDVYLHGVAYIKRELQDSNDLLKEYEEYFTKYGKKGTVQYNKRYDEYIDLKHTIDRLTKELISIKEKFQYTNDLIQSIKPATDEMMREDIELDRKEKVLAEKKHEKEMYQLFYSLIVLLYLKQA